MKIRLKGQYASKAAERTSPDSSPPNGRRSAKHERLAEHDSEEQQQDEDDEELGAEQQGAATSASSEADDDYLNAPLNDLPESSGDEYHAPPSMSTRPRGRPPKSKTRRSTRDSESPDARRPVRSNRASISSLAERPSITHPRRPIAAGASPASAAVAAIKRPRGRPPGSLNKKGKKGKGRSESVLDDEDESSADDMDDPDDSGILDEDEEDVSNVQSGQSTPSGRIVYGADGRRRGGAAVNTSRVKTVRGLKYELENDELSLPIDPKGEEKVDAMGHLQGGREYKGFTFSSPSRPEPTRLYMLAIDAARCAGFRDSLYFFRRNPWLHKINCSQEEKEFLIEKGRLHQNLRSRQVTIVTARNLYKVFGARFVKNGRYVTDDYYEAAAIAKGYKEGTPAYSEVYDPERDNTTLAMPKVGTFAKSKSEGRPAYMRMEKAFELLHRGMPMQDREEGTPEVDNYASHEERERERNKKRKEEEGGSSEDEFGNKIRKRKRPSAFTTLALPTTYRPQDFGLVTHPSYQSLVAGAQFGGNGQPPFGEQWERSKARKPAPFLNGFNWMYEFARFTSKESNRAVMGIRKEFNAYHRITLGVPGVSLTSQQVDEEQEGVWDISDEENPGEYETLDHFRHREGLDQASAAGPDGEVDDRKRGRSASPRLQDAPEPIIKGEVDTADMETDDTNGQLQTSSQYKPRRQRRRRSPLRGFYDAHTRLPQIKVDTQPAELLKYEQVALEPKFEAALIDSPMAHKAARRGIASVDYIMRRQ